MINIFMLLYGNGLILFSIHLLLTYKNTVDFYTLTLYLKTIVNSFTSFWSCFINALGYNTKAIKSSGYGK